MRHSVSNSWLTRGVVTAATAGLLVAGAAPALADDDAPQGPKNVILLIGDGMGYMHIDSTSLYETAPPTGRSAPTPRATSFPSRAPPRRCSRPGTTST